MSDSKPEDFTNGEGSIYIEIIAQAVPITPEILARKRTRAPWMIAQDEYIRQMDIENPPEKPE